jgi:hypothetical protein
MVKIRFIVDPRIKTYLKENPGAPFIMGFMTLLLSCAILLSTGHTPQADETAEYAYYLLVIGVILQFISFIKEGRTKQEEN